MTPDAVSRPAKSTVPRVAPVAPVSGRADRKATTRPVSALPPNLTEQQFQRTVIDLAFLHGWRVSHQRAAMVRSGRWATAITGHPGLPDLVLARRGVVILAELKTAKGRLSPGQVEWAAALGAHYRLWRPADFAAILGELRDGPETT